MKTLKRIFLILILGAVISTGFYYFYLTPKYVVPVLMYHRFGYEESTLFVTPENFQRQMQYLVDKKYNVISLDEYIKGKKSEEKFPRNTVVITIDDGFQDNFTYAYPVLKEHGFSATIFLIASYISAEDEYLGWAEAQEMLNNNILFGAHTTNNKYLPGIKNTDELITEIRGSKKIIEDNIGKKINYFCYPTGGFSEQIKEITRKAGYQAALTTNRGYAEGSSDLFEIKRVKVTNSDAVQPFHFPAKLSGYYNLFRSKKNPY